MGCTSCQACGGSLTGATAVTRATGRVIHVDPTYLGLPDRRWGRLLARAGVLGLAVYYFGLLILLIIAGLIAVAWLASRLLPTGFLTGVATQVAAFALTRRLVGPAVPSIPIRDVRVRDAAGNETLVRLKGQLTAGNLLVGDDVQLEGWERAGTVHFRRGYNNRLRAAIKVLFR
jgi:hypothetical protein